jgi:DNA polymerase I-like protein with 3'-5' exonuclease and polymerase domains
MVGKQMRLVFDIEATGSQRNYAHPFDQRNKMCNIGFYDIDTKETKIIKVEYDEEPYGQSLTEIQELLSQTTELIGFNCKFDWAWLDRYGLVLPARTRVYDCQLAFFILTAQKNPYPSLNGCSEHFGMEQKLDVVKEEYWDRGLDTDEVPYDILCDYLAQDLVVTANLYAKLQEVVPEHMKTLIKMSMFDLAVLKDTERNGLLLDVDKSLRKGDEIVKKINEIDVWLRKVFNADWFNPNSGDHLSVFLYGGVLELDGKETYTFTYKDGRTAEKQRNCKVPFHSKGLFKPLEGTALAKEGFYSTNEPTLTAISKSAKGEYKKILDTILSRAKLEKLRGTYYHGLPSKLEEMGWSDNIIHSNFNQCVAQSGRLSSTKPNVQNLAEEVKEVFITRFR